MNGEAADEVVRMALNGTEVAIRLTGSAAKNLAAILVAWSKNHKKVYGKTSMMKLLRSGEELQVLSLTKEQYKEFKASARRQVLFAPFVDTKSENEKVDVVIAAKSIPLVNHILERIGYSQVKDEPEEPSKKDTRSKRSSKDSKEQSEAKRSDRDRPKENPNGKRKPSVLTQLEANRKLIDKKERCSDKAAMSKYLATEYCNWIVDRAVQIFGGYGYMKDYIVERLYRDARVFSLYEGTTEVQKIVISNSLLRSRK